MDRRQRCIVEQVLCWGALVGMLIANPARAQSRGRAPDPVEGNTFYIDPVQGHIDNTGREESPWSTLQEVIEHRLIETRGPADFPYQPGGALVVKNPHAPVKAGDTLVLRSGFHGQLRLRGAYNQDVITVKAAQGHSPTLSRILLSAASRWHLEGLTVSPSFAEDPHAQPLIQVESHNWHGPSAHVVIADCNVYTVWDSVNWTLEDWNAVVCNGIEVSGDHMVVRNNRMKNVNFGISLSGNHGLVSHNGVENFAGDGLRGLGNDLVFEYNTVKNCYNVNDNHDDGFQSWSIKDDPARERIVLRGNIIMNYEDPNQPFRGPLQGIGCFDGPYMDWVIENNLIVVDHYHGISLYGAHHCRIVNNTVVDRNSGRPGPPWIRINPHKDKTPSSDCLIRNNIAPQVVATAGVSEDHNYLIRGIPRADVFVDPAHLDFHLRPESPVIDTGHAQLAPEVDLDGQLRPQGAGFDVGDYEFIVK